MHSPKLLLLDEPTAGVDPLARREFWDEIHLRAAGGLTVLVSTHYMDEAERCHRIHYISYGKLLTSGTVPEVVGRAGLATFVLEGQGLEAIARRLTGDPAIEQVAPFGATLHVVGHDAAAMRRSLDAVAAETGVAVARGETTLEDVFIQFMGNAEDNVAGDNAR
jgi:ABC-2 type transport system ATP-binding protein